MSSHVVARLLVSASLVALCAVQAGVAASAAAGGSLALSHRLALADQPSPDATTATVAADPSASPSLLAVAPAESDTATAAPIVDATPIAVAMPQSDGATATAIGDTGSSVLPILGIMVVVLAIGGFTASYSRKRNN